MEEVWSWWDGSLHEAEPGFALGEKQEGGEAADDEDGRIGEAGAFGEEDVEGEDVHDDRPEHQETDVTSFGRATSTPPRISSTFTKAR